MNEETQQKIAEKSEEIKNFCDDRVKNAMIIGYEMGLGDAETLMNESVRLKIAAEVLESRQALDIMTGVVKKHKQDKKTLPSMESLLKLIAEDFKRLAETEQAEPEPEEAMDFPEEETPRIRKAQEIG